MSKKNYTLKICTKCNEQKSSAEFRKNKKLKGGLSYICMDCNKSYDKRYNRTRDGLVRKIYGSQRQHSKKRDHPMPDYTKKELVEWIYSEHEFDELYKNWVNSGYANMKVPSVDRKNDYLPYTLDNLQLVTWKENFYRSHSDRRVGVNNKTNKAVIQMTLSGDYVAEYHSQRHAGRETGLCNASISLCCKGIRSHAGGFIWRFASPL